MAESSLIDKLMDANPSNTYGQSWRKTFASRFVEAKAVIDCACDYLTLLSTYGKESFEAQQFRMSREGVTKASLELADPLIRVRASHTQELFQLTHKYLVLLYGGGPYGEATQKFLKETFDGNQIPPNSLFKVFNFFRVLKLSTDAYFNDWVKEFREAGSEPYEIQDSPRSEEEVLSELGKTSEELDDSVQAFSKYSDLLSLGKTQEAVEFRLALSDKDLEFIRIYDDLRELFFKDKQRRNPDVE